MNSSIERGSPIHYKRVGDETDRVLYNLQRRGIISKITLDPASACMELEFFDPNVILKSDWLLSFRAGDGRITATVKEVELSED